MYKYLLITSLILSINTHFCIGQKALSEIDTYLFEEIFNSDNQIHEFIELSEESDTIRYWQFNSKRQLIKEVDKRAAYWSSSRNDKKFKSSDAKWKILQYNYLSNGKIKDIIERENGDLENEKSDTFSIHHFKYPKDNVIEEFYEIDRGKNKKFDILITKVMKDEQIESFSHVMKNYLNHGYIQTNLRSIYKYNINKKIEHKEYYSSVSTYSNNKKQEERLETLGPETLYSYDRLERLISIQEFEFEENGQKKLHKEIHFNYKGRSTKIKKIKVLNGEKYSPRERTFKIKYRINGSLKSIKINNNCFHYITK